MIRGSSTGVRGVHFKHGKFRAVGYHNRTPIYLGTFDKMDDAKKAYDLWKESPKPNLRQERRATDHHKEERPSVEIMSVIDAVFRRGFESGLIKIKCKRH